MIGGTPEDRERIPPIDRGSQSRLGWRGRGLAGRLGRLWRAFKPRLGDHAGAQQQQSTERSRAVPYFLSGVLFLIIPLLFVIAVSQLTEAKGPQWLPSSFENPYAYLFNSLLVVDGRAPTYVDHPGTTTEIFGGIILRLSSTKSADDLIGSVFQHPEKEIKELHWALLIFTALVLWVVPWLTARALRNHVAGLLIQAPALFSKTLLFFGILFGSDLMVVPFSIAAVCCCLLLLLPSSVPDKVVCFFGIQIDPPASPPSRYLRIPVLLLPALTGLVCALGIMTKLTFFPLILIAMACCRRRSNLAAFFVAFVLALALALLPIHPQVSRLARWTFDLGIHSGYYGTGPVGLPNASVYQSTLSQLFQAEPLLVLIPGITVTVVILLSVLPRERTAAHQTTWRTVLPVFALQLISYLAVAKHPNNHYLIPLFLTTGLSLVLLFYAFRTHTSAMSRAIGWLTLIGLLSLGFKDFVTETLATASDLRDQQKELLRLYQHAKEITKNDVRVDYFFSDSPEYPLCYGDVAASGAFGQLLARMYPKALFFDVFNGKFQTFTEMIDPEVELQKHDHLYFLGNRKFFPRVDGLDPDTFETIDHAGDYYLRKWTRRVRP
jgi:hypothetical protein